MLIRSENYFSEEIKEKNSIVSKPALGYEGRYLVDTSGSVYSLLSRKYRKLQRTKNHYLRVGLIDQNGKKTDHLVHCLIADAFIPNPRNLSDIHHKDGNRQNNQLSNLLRMSHADHIALHKRQRVGLRDARHAAWHFVTPVEKRSRSGELLKTYSSVNEASRAEQISAGNISRCCNGKRVFAGGYKWKRVLPS